MPLDLTSNTPYLRTIQIYENEKVRTHSLNKTLLIFTINRLKYSQNNTGNAKLEETLIEHKSEYDKKSFDVLIRELSKDPKTQLRLVEEVKCIFGFVKFYFGYYAILVTEISKVGKIGDFIINRVDKLKMLPLFLVNNTNFYLDLENKYLTIFKNFDPSKQVYFSFTYDITKTLQRNFVENFKKESNGATMPVEHSESQEEIDPDNNSSKKYNHNLNLQNSKGFFELKKVTNNTFLWNHNHIKEFYKILTNKVWVNFFIYGFFEQVECMNYGLRFLLTIIARRNRKYAGTRYLKRGINDDGNVANDVETEQILEEISTSCPERPVISSYIHIRGSVPIYWYQEQNGILPKPDIKVNYCDAFYETTKKHFNLLNRRYGKPIIVCNLTKIKEGDHKQEELLNDCYSEGVDYLNSYLENNEDEKIIYYHYDLKKERRQVKFYRHFYEISYCLIEKTKMFSFIPHLRSQSSYFLELQSGIIRSNCVDCLDRTNVFQQVIGTAVMVNQLRSMGVNAKEPNNEEEMFGTLTEVYKKMGHELSSQYAGSLAHKQTIKDNRNMMNKVIDKFPEVFNTFKRYFNNSFNDQYKQASINLFLGKYKIKLSSNSNQMHLWDLLTDVMLHRKNKSIKLTDNWAAEAFKYYQKYNLIEDLYVIANNKSPSNGDENSISEIKSNSNSNCFLDTSIRENNIKPNKVSILDYISLTQSKLNTYYVNLQKIQIYKKKINYIKTINEVDSFNYLDIDHKSQIKNFYGFNYNTNYETEQSPKNNLNIFDFPNSNLNSNSNLTISAITIKKIQPQYSSKTKTMIDTKTTNFNLDDNETEDITPILKRCDTKIYNSNGVEDINNQSNLRHSYNLQIPRKITKRHGEWSFKKTQSSDDFKFGLRNVEKPKYEMKITSFEMDANEINLVNEFVDPDPKYLQNSEYQKLDYFLNIDINNENYTKIFDANNFEDEWETSRPYYANNEFVEEFINKIHNYSSKKKEHKLGEVKNEDYLIYDVEEKQFYKKLKRDLDQPYDIKSGPISSGTNKLIREESPKVKVKVKKIPLKVFEDHI